MNPSQQPEPATPLADLAARFQAAWQANPDDPSAIDLAAFLPPSGDPLRVEALARLIPIDLSARWRYGIPLSLEDYIVRYPEIGPLDRVPPQLIAAEYRIRAEHGVISPNTVLRQRFPNQYADVERLIQSNLGMSAETVISKTPHQLFTKELVVGDHYRLNRLIGRGGFGEVWHATDLRGNIDKAIKILTRAADSEEAQKELESLDLIKRINHPYLLRTESYYVEKDRLFIVLELADATLRDVLKKTQTELRTGIKSDELLRHMKHAAEGLDFLHKQGILHRDIKPENILLVGDFGKVADFGLAKEARNKQSTKADFAGTVVYSAPETWDGRVTTRSDQYSLACTYFEMRTGRVLFSGKTFQEVFLKHMQANPSLEPLPDLEQDMLRRALSKKPEDRFETCALFVKALEDAVLASGSKVVESKPPLESPGKTRQQPGKTTQEVHTLASLGGSPLRAEGEQKWNQPTHRRTRSSKPRRGPWIAVGLLLIAGAAAAGAFVLIEREPQPDLPVAPQPQGDPPKVAKIAPIPNPVIEPKPQPKPPDRIPVKVPIKPPEPPPLSPERLKLVEARKLFDAKKYFESRKVLEAIGNLDLANNSDGALKDDSLALYADLLRADAYTLPELRTLSVVIADAPAVKSAFTAAMTKRLVDLGPTWLESPAEWEQRLRDCDRADPNNRLILAMKAEALFFLPGKKASAQLPAATDEEPVFIAYVRARQKAIGGNTAAGAEILGRLPIDEEWFVKPRRTQPIVILLDGAASLAPTIDGRPKLFANIDAADRASNWWLKARALAGANVSITEFEQSNRLNAALAAAYRSQPDFAETKKLADSLMADESFAKSKAALDLVLAHPAGFPKEFAALRAKLTSADLDAALKYGDEQRTGQPTNAALRSRQALLFYTKARLLDRNPDTEPTAILDADNAAAALEPDNIAYRVAKARDHGLVAIAAANQQASAAGRIASCKSGLADSAAPPQSESAELWPDLGRVRAILFLDLGRSSDWKSQAAKKAFRDSINSAEAAYAKAPDPAKGEIAATLAQAHEALAYLSQVDAQPNYQAADRFYGEAEKMDPRYAFQRGRCLYRWANDDPKDAKKRAELLSKAVAEFQIVAKIADFPAAAEAGYWEGLAYWDLTKRFTASPKAFEAFDRALKAAAANPATGAAWAGTTLTDFVAMTKLQAKNAPEGSVAEMLKIEPAVKSLSNSLAGNSEFDEAVGKYRNLLAEASVDAAGRVIAGKVKDFKKYREHLDRAVELKHSSEHALLAVKRAVGFKKNAEAMGLTAGELMAIRTDTIAAIGQISDASVGAVLRKELDAGWQ